MKLPDCGLYRTRSVIGPVPEGRLVFFHNHGRAGPGVYLPESWKGNRMQPASQGTRLAEDAVADALEALPPEGFYRVVDAFDCCGEQCRRFEAEALVQLGYNGEAKPILFVPEIIDGMLAIPERGRIIDAANLEHIRHLSVKVSSSDTAH